MTHNNPHNTKESKRYKRLSSEDKQIEDLMHRYMKNTDKEARFRIFDALSEYGSKGIDAINELIKVTGSDELVVYGLGIIKKIR
jgi:hypothetical protein